MDTTFLTVHPRTALWWEQREQCAKCTGCTRAAAGGQRCTFSKMPGTSPIAVSRRRRDERGVEMLGARLAVDVGIYCIDAREPGMPCGPDAKMFEAAA